MDRGVGRRPRLLEAADSRRSVDDRTGAAGIARRGTNEEDSFGTASGHRLGEIHGGGIPGTGRETH